MKKYENLPPDLDWYTYLTEDFKLHRKQYRIAKKAVFDCPKCGGTDVVRIGHVIDKIKKIGSYICSKCRKGASAARGRAASYAKYGRNPGSTPEAQAKIRQTTLKNHGVSSSLQLKSVHEKGIKAAAKKKEAARKNPYDLSGIDPTKGSYFSQYYKLRRKQDPAFAAQCAVRGALGRLMKGFKVSKSSVFHSLGYTAEELKAHLESQFTEGMSWANYGEWHVDHIMPLFTFDCTNLEEVKKANALKNLRPLWAKDNLRRPKNLRRL